MADRRIMYHGVWSVVSRGRKEGYVCKWWITLIESRDVSSDTGKGLSENVMMLGEADFDPRGRCLEKSKERMLGNCDTGNRWRSVNISTNQRPVQITNGGEFTAPSGSYLIISGQEIRDTARQDAKLLAKRTIIKGRSRCV